MSTAEIRKELQSYINKADERFINMVYAMAKEYSKNSEQIVGYQPDGRPVTKIELLNDLKEADEQIERGEYLTIEELEREANNW
jgi:uncharacterized coiled-coil DUF342 family protein